LVLLLQKNLERTEQVVTKALTRGIN